jgi:hypothetical protein
MSFSKQVKIQQVDNGYVATSFGSFRNPTRIFPTLDAVFTDLLEEFEGRKEFALSKKFYGKVTIDRGDNDE